VKNVKKIPSAFHRKLSREVSGVNSDHESCDHVWHLTYFVSLMRNDERARILGL